MKISQKEKIIEKLEQLINKHRDLELVLKQKDIILAVKLLVECQEYAINIGQEIELYEGEGLEAVTLLERYCEEVFLMHQKVVDIGTSTLDVVGLDCLMKQIVNRADADIPLTYEIVFMPYNSSMWDSLESIWVAAKNDPRFTVFVIPIPYYDKNPDGSLGKMHYEANKFPENVPIVSYETYKIEERLPDIIYIHNPYDYMNYVTTIEPRFYARELKKYCEMLIYVPYYVTAGVMGDAQTMCPVYDYADYIVIQKDYIKYAFDSSIPNEKFLSFGSPKFDRMIKFAKEDLEIPDVWKRKVKNRRVYFYNTSIAGMLGSTMDFLMKMEYIFKCFQERGDACLLWRPHPLLESTFLSVRKEFYPIYEKLKRYFIQSDFGIYDETPDVTRTIAFCDAYIGDEGTSLTALFGVAGKPVFILDNKIHSAPKDSDWRGKMVGPYFFDGHDDWRIVSGNMLYHSVNKDYKYTLYAELPKSKGEIYHRAMEINEKIFVCPVYASDILVMKNRKVINRISIEEVEDKLASFGYPFYIDEYIFFVPTTYPALIRLNTKTEEIEYFDKWNDDMSKEEDGIIKCAGGCAWGKNILIASLKTADVLLIDSESMKEKRYSLCTDDDEKFMVMVPNGSDIWMLPFKGNSVTKWNIETGEIRKYSNMPEQFQCVNRPYGFICEDFPFSSAAFYEDKVILAPFLGNMFVELDQNTGEAKEWISPFEEGERVNSGYSEDSFYGLFLNRNYLFEDPVFRFYHNEKHRLFDLNIETKECNEVDIRFDMEELYLINSGFYRYSETIRYGCLENAFCSLSDFLDDKIKGEKFNKEKQYKVYEEIAENIDGTCGAKVHEFISNKYQNEE